MTYRTPRPFRRRAIAGLHAPQLRGTSERATRSADFGAVLDVAAGPLAKRLLRVREVHRAVLALRDEDGQLEQPACVLLLQGCVRGVVLVREGRLVERDAGTRVHGDDEDRQRREDRGAQLVDRDRRERRHARHAIGSSRSGTRG